MPARRDELARVRPGPSTHAGLWLDGYVEDFQAQAAVAGHVGLLFRQEQDGWQSVPRLPAGYEDFITRHREGLKKLPPSTTLALASAAGRLAVGLGGESVLETAIALHRTWGVPYLPGSALKGLAARAARLQLDSPWDPQSAEYRTVFGDTQKAGAITFHDALLLPADTGDLPLSLDVMTVHHAAYYGHRPESGQEPPPPADWDDPNPVPFVTAHGDYLLALTGPPDWLDLAFQILADALENDGIGAKTAAGYGRMKVAR